MVFFKNGELKILLPFYLECFSRILFILPGFMVIYFLGLGLNLFQIGILLAVWPLFALIFEIPTGAIADLYGRKFSVLTGIFLQAIIFLMFFFYHDYYLMILFMGLIGIFSTFVSGADKAWVTDLINKKDKRLLHDYFSKSLSFTSIGFVVSGLLGAIFVKFFGINIIWLVTSLGFFLSFFIMLFAKEEHIKKRIRLKGSFNDVNKKTIDSIKFSYKKKILFYILIASLIFSFALNFSTIVTWTPLLKNFSFPDYAFGYLISFIALIGVIFPLVSRKLLRQGKEREFIIKTLIGLILFSIIFILVNNMIFALIAISGLCIFNYSMIPTKNVYFQRFIPKNLRATINSIDSMLASLAITISYPLVGLLTDILGPKITIFISGLIMIIPLVIYLFIKRLE